MTALAGSTVPATPVGKQLDWLLGIWAGLPLGDQEISTHFDTGFLDAVDPSALNQDLESLGPAGAKATLLELASATPSSLAALVQIGPTRYSVTLSVDSTGLIAGLLFRPDDPVPRTWSELDSQLSAVAPQVSFLAAKVQKNGSCITVHSLAADTPRPLGSMFKLFVLGAVANAVREHRISWHQKLTITGAIKVGGSGTLQSLPDGTTITVQNAALKMISISDNTAADLLLKLVGRAFVEEEVRKWTSHPSLDIPFLTVSELFALKYYDFPSLADHYLSLRASQRASYLTSRVDKVPEGDEQPTSSPRDVNSVEWFASADDLCRVFSGLSTLRTQSGLSPIGSIMSDNNGGISLSPTTWPTVWFKGGSESGVLTLGYLARDSRGQTFVVVALTDNPARALDQLPAEGQLLAVIAGAFGMLR